MRWIIIGTGNVAWHLTRALMQAGEDCIGVVSRELDKAKVFANALSPALLAYSFEELVGNLPLNVDVYLLAVADDALIDTASKIACLPPTLALHTSGTRPLIALNGLAEAGWKTGVFYPLQTLSRQKAVDWKQIPLLIESENLPTLQELEEVAKRISSTVVRANSEQRRWLHLVAVMTSNFMHHLITIGSTLLEKQNLQFTLLEPLLRETLEKALMPYPATTQTGPAKRGDTHTIENHIALLQDFPAWQNVYKALTNSLIELYSVKD